MAVKTDDELLEAFHQALEAVRQRADDISRKSTTRPAARQADEITMRQVADEFNLPEDALLAFAQTVGELLNGERLSVKDAQRAGILAAASVAWEHGLGPLLSSAHVRELLGHVSRQRVDELLRAHRLIGLRDSSGRRRFPIFQFNDGRPIESLVAAFWTVADAGLDDWTAASWCVAPDPALDGDSPAQWTKAGKSSERLFRIARQAAARFAR